MQSVLVLLGDLTVFGGPQLLKISKAIDLSFQMLKSSSRAAKASTSHVLWASHSKQRLDLRWLGRGSIIEP